MWPHSAHLRRCNHHPPRAKHSAQPVPLGSAAGLMPSLSDFIGSSRPPPECTRSPRMLSCVCCLAVGAARLALANFYNITIRIAKVAEHLAVLVPRLRDELGSSTSP